MSDNRPAKLEDQIRDACRVRHYSLATERSYVRWYKQFVRWAGLKHPATLGADRVQAWLSYLATERDVAASTQRQALQCACRCNSAVRGWKPVALCGHEPRRIDRGFLMSGSAYGGPGGEPKGSPVRARTVPGLPTRQGCRPRLEAQTAAVIAPFARTDMGTNFDLFGGAAIAPVAAAEPKRIALSGGHVAVVDAEDYEALAAFKWSATVSGGKVYAHRRRRRHEQWPTCQIAMHRAILGLRDANRELYVDHLNGDTLDNRRANLRLCKPGENSRNISKVRAETGMRGVTKTRGGKWRVRIRFNYRLIDVGTFETERDASVAYCFASRMLHGEFGSTPGHVLPAGDGGRAVRSPLDTLA